MKAETKALHSSTVTAKRIENTTSKMFVCNDLLCTAVVHNGLQEARVTRSFTGQLSVQCLVCPP